MSMFRGLRVLYCAMLFVGTVALLLLLPEAPGWLRPVVIGVWLVAVFITCEAVGYSRLKKVNSLLDDCRVREYADYWERMLPRVGGKNALTAKLNLAAGYLEMGEAQRALDLLQTVPALPEKGSYASYRLVYDNNMLVARRMLGQLDEADALLQAYRQHLDAVPPKLAERTRIRPFYENQTMLQRMARGDFDGAAPFFAERLRTAPTLRSRVSASYSMAWALCHEGRADEARPHLTFAAEQGGDTWYASAARERLEQL